jgi:hypothetical protein
VASQLALLQQHAWTGSWFLRGFTDSGNPLGAENVYLEPNLLAMKAGLLDAGNLFGAMTRLAALMQTPIGPKIATSVPGGALGVVPGDPDLDVVQSSLTLLGSWLASHAKLVAVCPCAAIPCALVWHLDRAGFVSSAASCMRWLCLAA